MCTLALFIGELHVGTFSAEGTFDGVDFATSVQYGVFYLPLTVTLAGLPTSEGRLYSEEQIEARGMTIRAAYRVARNVAKECLGGS